MKIQNWKGIVNEDVLDVQKMDGGFANDVWQVRTVQGEYVVKVIREPPSPDRPFWDGLQFLFGMNVFSHIEQRREMGDFIRKHTFLKVPDVHRIDTSRKLIDAPYVVIDRMPGDPLDLQQCDCDTSHLAEALGRHLGSLHSVSFAYWGTYPSGPRYAPADWPARCAETLRYLAERYFQDEPAVQRDLPGFVQQAAGLPGPERLALVLPDLRPDQFLQVDHELTALVDVEAHVIGPSELDLILMEYVLKPEDASAFKSGYQAYLTLPDLKALRPLYRYLYFLITALGWKDYQAWMEHPAILE